MPQGGELRSGKVVGDEAFFDLEGNRADLVANDDQPSGRSSPEPPPQVNQWLRILSTRAESIPMLPSGEMTRIAYFSGEETNGPSVNEFIDRFNLVARLYGFKNDVRARILPIYLTGRALDFYATLSKQVQKDYPKLVTALRNAFLNSHRSRCAVIELRNRTKRDDESIVQYADVMRKLARQAFPTATYADQNRNASLDFVFGLPTDLSSRVLDRNPETLDSALDFAVQISNSLELAAKIRAARGCTPQNRSENDPVEAARLRRPPKEGWGQGRENMRYERFYPDPMRSGGYSNNRRARTQQFWPQRDACFRNPPPFREMPAFPRTDARDFSRRNFRRPASEPPMYDNQRQAEHLFRPRQQAHPASQPVFVDEYDTILRDRTSRQPAPRWERQNPPSAPRGNPRPQLWTPRPMAKWTPDGQPICHTCGRKGHMARNCTNEQPGPSGQPTRFHINHVQVSNSDTPESEALAAPVFAYDQPYFFNDLPPNPEADPESNCHHENENLVRHFTPPASPDDDEDKDEFNCQLLVAAVSLNQSEKPLPESSARANEFPHNGNSKTDSPNCAPSIAVAGGKSPNSPTVSSRNYEQRSLQQHRRASAAQRQPEMNSVTHSLSVYLNALWLYFIVLALSATPTNTYPHPMVCPLTAAKTLYDLKQPKACMQPHSPKSHPTIRKYELYKPNLVLYESKAYHCLIVRKIQKSLEFFFRDERRFQEHIDIVPVTKQECQRMLKEKTCQYGVLHFQEGGAYATQNSNPAKYQWCCFWREFVEENCHLVPMTVFKRHGAKDMESTSGDVSHCKYSSGDCRLSDGSRMIWTPNEQAQCKYIPYKNVTGRYWAKHWISEELQLLLTFNQRRTIRDCKQRLIKSDQGVCVKLLSPVRSNPKNRTRSRARKGRPRRHSPLIGTDSFEAAGRQFDAHKLYNYTKLAFSTAAANLCHHAASSFLLMKSLLISDPTLAMRILLKNDYIFARGVGRYIEARRCEPITQYTFVRNDACYKDVPIKITYSNRTIFGTMDPQTNIVDVKPKRAHTCYLGALPICVNGSCAHYIGFSGELDHKGLAPVDVPLLSTLELAASPPPPPHVIYHSLAIFNFSTLSAHISRNQIARSKSLEKQALAGPTSDNTFRFSTPLQRTFSSMPGTLSIVSWLGINLAGLMIWEFCVCLIVTAYLGIKLTHWLFGRSRTLIGLTGRAYVAVTLRRDRESQNSSEHSQEAPHENPPPSAPPLPQNATPEGPPSYISDWQHSPLAPESRASSFERWPPEYTETVAACGADTKSVVKVEVNNVATKGLLDTGSAITILSQAFADKLRLEPDKTTIAANSISGQKLPIKGVVKASFRVAGTAVEHTAYVLPGSPFNVILGVDLLNAFGNISIDYSSGRAVINGRAETLHAERRKLQCLVKTTGPICLPPHSESRVPAKLTQPLTTPVLIDPLPRSETRTPILVARIITTPQDNTVPLRLINPSEAPKHIPPNTPLAQAEDFECIDPPPLAAPLPPELQKPFLNMFTWPENLSQEQLTQLQDLILTFHSVFSKHDLDLGCLDTLPQRIELTGPMPPPARPYRVPQSQEAALKQQIDALLEAKVISHSTSPYSSPIILIKKKDGTLRLVVDYRRLNKVVKTTSFPLPLIADTIDRLGNARYFSTLDLNSGFFQLKLAEEHADRTAFATPYGLYQFNRLPMGICNAPANFQRVLSAVLAGLQHSICLIYLDDVICYSETFGDHIHRLREIFFRLHLHNLKLKPRKCQFAKHEVKYLGHIVSADGLHPDPENVAKVRDCPVPRTTKDIKSVIGLASYYRKFIQGFAKIAAPLHALMKKNARFRWTEEHQTAFETLKQALTQPPLLAYPDFKKTFILATDASEEAIGAVLSQSHEGHEKPIAYASRALNKAERNYSTTEKELLAIVYALRFFRSYIYGRKFVIITDHKPLQHLMSHKDASSRMMRWATAIQEYDMEVKYKPGSQHRNADALSRLPQTTTVAAITRSKQPEELTTDQKALREEQTKHPLFGALMNKLQGKPLPSNLSRDNRNFVRRNWETFRLRKGLLYRLTPTQNLALVLTPDYAYKMWTELHSGVFGAHLGTQKTLSRLESKYWWKNIGQDVHKWNSTCVACDMKKRPIQTTRVPLKPLPIPSTPFERIAMDVVGPLPLTNQGNKYLLVFSEYLTRWPEAVALPSQSAESVANQFVNKIICRHGCPQVLLTDRGANFTSNLMAEVCRLTQSTKALTTAYHPATDGLVERLNGTLLQMLSFYVNERQTDWDEHIDIVLFCYRTAKQASTKASPFCLLYGREPRLPADAILQQPQSAQPDANGATPALSFPDRMKRAWATARQCLEKAQATQKAQYDKKANASADSFSVNDRVYVFTPTVKKGQTHKFTKRFHGPQRILSLDDTNAIVVMESTPRAKPQKVHLNRLKLARDQTGTLNESTEGNHEKEQGPTENETEQ